MKNHVHSLLTKLNVSTRVEAAMYGRRALEVRLKPDPTDDQSRPAPVIRESSDPEPASLLDPN